MADKVVVITWASIDNPQAEQYTNPASVQMARRY